MQGESGQLLQELTVAYKKNPEKILEQFRLCTYEDKLGHLLTSNVLTKGGFSSVRVVRIN